MTAMEMKPKLTSFTGIQLIKPFFKGIWSKTEPKDVIIEQITTGYCNTIYKVTRNLSDYQNDEPLSLIIRISGGNRVDMTQFDTNNDYNAIMVVAYEMSRRKLGPKLYGIFNYKDVGVGTIEEYIEGHTLTPKEAADPSISKEIATQLAKVHSIQGLPLKMNSKQTSSNQMKKYIERYESIKNEMFKYFMVKEGSIEEQNLIKNFDMKKEFEYFEDVIKKSNCRTTLTLDDMNYNNCIVRDLSNIADENRSDIMFIDYDTVQYNFRGNDFASHFMGRVIRNGSEENVIPGGKFPTQNEMEIFFKHYQDELRSLGVFEDFNENGIDSIDNLIADTIIGYFDYCLSIIGLMFTQYEQFWKKEDNFFGVTMLCLKKYYGLKQQLQQ